MLNPRLAGRYAKSLLDLSLEQGSLEETLKDMQWLESVVKQSPEFTSLLRSPVIPADTKEKAIEAVAGKNLGKLTYAFIKLLVRKGREFFLPEIITGFIKQYKKHMNIHTVQLTTAVPVSDSLRQSIMEQVKKSAGFEKIEIDEKVDENIIGGFVLQVGDQLVDASIAYDLREVARQFENNDFIYKVR